MDHPNIASVYDAGATIEGRPYFVMEFVPARPPSVGYRAQNFIRRNRRMVTAAGLVAFAAVAGLITSFALYLQADRERRNVDAQRAEADVQRQEATLRRGEAKAEGARANAARAETERQKTAAEHALQTAETDLYFNNLGLAGREWIDGNIALVDRLLVQAPTRLRDWEWRYLMIIAHTEEAIVRVGASGSMPKVAFCSPTASLRRSDCPVAVCSSAPAGSILRRTASRSS